MPTIDIYNPNPAITHLKLTNGVQRWAGNGASGAAGTGNQMRDESGVTDTNYANGLLAVGSEVVKILTGTGTFEGRYVLTIPSTLPASLLPYVVEARTSNLPGVNETGSQWIEFFWDGARVIGQANAVLAATGIDLILVESGISASALLTDDAATQLTAINLRQAFAVAVSALAGILAGPAGPTTTTKPLGKPTGNTRISAAVDVTGRTAITLKVPV